MLCDLEAFKSIGLSMMTTDPNEQVICVLFAEAHEPRQKTQLIDVAQVVRNVDRVG